MIISMPAHVQSTALVTSTFRNAGIVSKITKCCSTLLDSDARPQKRTATINPEWVITFAAVIVLLVVITIVLAIIVVKLAKTNKVTTEFPCESNHFYDEIQLYGKLNKLWCNINQFCDIKFLGLHNCDLPAADTDNDIITNTKCQLETEYDYPAVLLNQRESIEHVENDDYNYATIINA